MSSLPWIILTDANFFYLPNYLPSIVKKYFTHRMHESCECMKAVGKKSSWIRLLLTLVSIKFKRVELNHVHVISLPLIYVKVFLLIIYIKEKIRWETKNLSCTSKCAISIKQSNHTWNSLCHLIEVIKCTCKGQMVINHLQETWGAKSKSLITFLLSLSTIFRKFRRQIKSEIHKTLFCINN